MIELSVDQKDKVLEALRVPVSLEHAAAIAGLKVSVLEYYLEEVNKSESVKLVGFGGQMIQAMAEGMLTFMNELKSGNTGQMKVAYFEIAKETIKDIKAYMNADKVKRFRDGL